MPKDYYEILGINKDASSDEIKKAFRKQSLLYHPDRPGNEGNHEKFQEINEAHDVLSNSEKRMNYDNELNGIGHNPFMGMHPGMHPMGAEFADINNIFNSFFRGGGGGMPGMGGPGGFHNVHVNMDGMPGIRIFHNGNPFFGLNKPPPIIKNVEISMEKAYSGCSIPVEIEKWIQTNDNRVTKKESLNIDIPAGISENEILIIRDAGNSINGNINGDIKIVIQIINGTPFERHGNDLLLKKKITLKEALCGFTFDVKHLNGKTLAFNNGSGSQTIIKPNYKKIVAGLGFTKDGNTGNLIIEFDVEFPDSLRSDQIDTLRNIL